MGENIVKTGFCKFCGQMQALELSRELAEEKVTSNSQRSIVQDRLQKFQSAIIREGDEFTRTNTNGVVGFTHNPKFPSTSDVIGAYAYVRYTDGTLALDVMSKEELENTRKHSKMANGGAWKDFTNEMYRKTVLRRLCKYIDLDFENPTQVEMFNAGMEIETDTEKIVEAEIAENANTEVFDIEDIDASEAPFVGE